uniref:Uncharacterized protein n=1 Tax=Anguilla anguilla TaxID=7936 RepID=A0A0E9T8R3_ANGAN
MYSLHIVFEHFR